MTDVPFDESAAHRHYAAGCFNKTWDLLDRSSRSAEEDRQMLLLAMTSIWHWTQRPDCTPMTLSVGHWLISRVYATLGNPSEAERFGQYALDAIRPVKNDPFTLGYAYEALARAMTVGGDAARATEYLVKAKTLCEAVTDEEARRMLASDLENLAVDSCGA